MPFVTCPTCACPAKTTETECPSCGSRLRGPDGGIARTAIAALLGLTAATGLAACSGGPSAPKYGVPATDGPVPTAEPSAPPPTEPTQAPEYGVPATQPGPEVRPLYGIPATPDSSGQKLPPG
ncbi:MAG: hypothetical protein JNK04_16095 [Myxococcales bacterium]|nr:hypothetical protein [Myxococcales bacterium]